MTRHRPLEKVAKGSSDARLASDPRRLIPLHQKWTKYSGDYLKYIVRPNKGVGRPAAARREQLLSQTGKRWGWIHPKVAELCRDYAKYGDSK